MGLFRGVRKPYSLLQECVSPTAIVIHDIIIIQYDSTA